MLISTKIHPPQLKSNLLYRKHLLDRLEEGRGFQLILISGPAGYGKTSLAGQWIKQDNSGVAWYSIDDTDNDFDIFFRYFLAALIEAENGLEPILGPLLQDRNRLSADDIIPTIVHALNALSGDLYVIMDDYHMITVDGIHSAVARLLKYLPSKVHFVIISRHRLPRSLCRFRCKFDMVEITPDDLKFSEQEAQHFFKQVIPLDLTRRQVQELNRFAGGWATGFQIFGLSQRGKNSGEGSEKMLRAASREAMDYLIDEVVMAQPEKVKTFLYQTAVLYRLNADVCRHVTGLPDSGKILSDLHRMNLFLVPLDPEHTWYRYHHLFSEAVREWVRISSPGLLTQARRKAAKWFAENHYLEEAFQYASASGDAEFMADLFEDYLIFLIDRYKMASTLKWLSKLPLDVFLRRPLLRMFECIFKIQQMQLADVAGVLPEIEGSLNEVIGRYEEPKKTICKDDLVYVKTALYYYQDVFNVDIQKMNAGIERISPKNRHTAGYLKIMIAATYFHRGDLISAEKQMKPASVDIFSSEYVSDKMFWATVMAPIKRLQGRLKQSEKILLDAFAFLSRWKISDTPLKILLHLPMAWISYQRNELDKALAYGMHGLRYLERDGEIDVILSGYYLLSIIYMAKGDLKKAMQYAQKSKSLSESLDYPSRLNFTDELFFLLSIRLGNTDVSKKRAALGKPDMSEPFSIIFLSEAMILAVSLLNQGKFSEASRVLEALRKRCAKRSIMELVLQIDVLLSGIYWLMGKKEPALTIMEQAILFAEEEGYIRPFVNYAALIFPLLKDLDENSKPLSRSAHFKSLLKACDVEKDGIPMFSNAPPKKNAFNLTERELEILRLMSDGYKNRQIADMAFISLSTVKTHIHHIFNKLDVKSRLQAIIKTKELLHPRIKP